MSVPDDSDQALASKLAGLSRFADNVNTAHDPVAQRLADQINAVAQRLADQINASDPGVFIKAEIAAIVRATIALCITAGVDPCEAGPHVIETLLGHREFGTAGQR